MHEGRDSHSDHIKDSLVLGQEEDDVAVASSSSLQSQSRVELVELGGDDSWVRSLIFHTDTLDSAGEKMGILVVELDRYLNRST